MKDKDYLRIAAFILAMITLIFGNNMFQQLTGKSIFDFFRIWRSTSTPTIEKYTCPFTANSDDATIRYIIDTESSAAINEDFNTLELVYFADATISDAGKVWHDPIQHYKDSFTTYDILDVNNSDIRIQFTSDKNAIVYRTSFGRVLTKGTQEISKYTDDSGKILFQKDTNGCWRISKFDKAPNGYK